MKGGTGRVMFVLTRDNPVTELFVQVISGCQEQWEVFDVDGIQWLRNGGDCKYDFSFRRTACSWSCND